MPRITLDWLMATGTPCGEAGAKRSWNAKQQAIFAKILGVSHLGKGWTRNIIGCEISLVDVGLVERLRGARKKTPSLHQISLDDPDLALRQVIELVDSWSPDARDKLYWHLNGLRTRDLDDDIPF